MLYLLTGFNEFSTICTCKMSSLSGYILVFSNMVASEYKVTFSKYFMIKYKDKIEWKSCFSLKMCCVHLYLPMEQL